MSSIASDIAELLETVTRPGDFCTSGTVELLAPSLTIDGIGQISLPLLPVQAEQIAAAAEQAPYGRGQDTLVDTSVRRTWQLGPDKVHIQGRHWPRTLEAILARVSQGLGVSDPIEAAFYKLLLYDPGSFFVSHRDTEKAPGMFATLVIVLPSQSRGGELVVRHQGREMRLDMCCKDAAEACYAAFYADCLHEVMPVTAGWRIALTYNLLRCGRGKAPTPPNYTKQQQRAAALLQHWRDQPVAMRTVGPSSAVTDEGEFEEDDGPWDDGALSEDEAEDNAPVDDAGDYREPRYAEPDDESPANATPLKLVCLLEHAYTQAELGFHTLKGADAAAAGVLAAAARMAGCDLHLALLTREESGSAEYTGYYGRRRYYDDNADEEFEVGEIYDWSVKLSEWRSQDGAPAAFGEIPVIDAELSPPDAFENLEPDEVHFREATGNEGASFERSYRRAALVLWPHDRTFLVLNQAGLHATLPYLEDIAERSATASRDAAATLRRDAHELADAMIATWPTKYWQHPHSDKPTDAARMLAALARLRDTVAIETFLTSVTAAGVFARADAVAMLDALRLLPRPKAVALVEQIVRATGAESFAACASLLSHAAAETPDQASDLRDAAEALVGTLPRAAKPEPAWQSPGLSIDPSFVADLLHGLARIDAVLADRAVNHILAWPRSYDPDRVLVPAAKRLHRSAHNSRAIGRLLDACLTHLRTRIAEPLAPPADWRRASAVGCHCADCRELSLFLGDPSGRVWVFKAAQQRRDHVASTIQTAKCDVDTATDQRGRPYSLICTKNQASYERRVKQRAQDVADLAELTAS